VTLSLERLLSSLNSPYPDIPIIPQPHMVFRETHMFDLESTIHARLLQSPHRTLNPDDADVYYVPYYPTSHRWGGGNQVTTSALHDELLQLLSRKWPYWNRHNGKDHIMAFGMIEREMRESCSHCTNLLNHALAAPMTVFGIERNARKGAPSEIIVAPYPSLVHFISPPPPRPSLHERPFLVAFVGKSQQLPLRMKLIQQLNASPDCVVVEDVREMRGAGKLPIMQYSTFCLHPYGDSPTRKSYYDGILLGNYFAMQSLFV
jgi:xyloglucan galactosyltransferase MUR3